VADSEVYVTPSGPQMQLNPHVDEEPVPKPEVARNESSQMGAVLFKQALAKAQSLVAEEEYVAALRTLSVFYKSPDLTEQQHRELLDLLDPLAGRVIYSREHLLTRPCTVGRGQTLADIAQQYNVPAQLLQKINGIESPNVLLPGSELKVVPGPFHADVDLVGQELTLFVDGLYAGRFPVSLGTDPQPKEGEFHVREKQLGKTYFALDGRTVPAESPNNPFGRVWMDLGREVCIHGSPASGSDSQHGCISLSPRDAEDVYSILSVGSKVRILR
jgi:LysM repeat protein